MGKFCANCGKELTENAKFCSGCGKPVEVYTEWQQTNKKRYQSKTSIIIFLIILLNSITSNSFSSNVKYL